MYDEGSAIGTDKAVNQLKNEIAYSNIIAVANNQALFNMLDKQTQENLIKIIGAYTKANVDVMITGKRGINPGYDQPIREEYSNSTIKFM